MVTLHQLLHCSTLVALWCLLYPTEPTFCADMERVWGIRECKEIRDLPVFLDVGTEGLMMHRCIILASSMIVRVVVIFSEAVLIVFCRTGLEGGWDVRSLWLLSVARGLCSLSFDL